MKTRQGLSLIELLISISVFSIVMLALSGLIVSGLNVRKGNDAESRALSYANGVLERYKSFWIEASNYSTGIQLQVSQLPGVPAGLTPTLSFQCVDVDGSVISDSTCSTMIPPLRRISLVVKDADGIVLADLKTEIGNPAP